MPVEYISTMDPTMAALLGIGIGVWAPDRFTNEVVTDLASRLVAKKSSASPDDVRDDLLQVDRSDTEPETNTSDGDNNQ